MDCNMPVIDGYEASKTIKKLYVEDKIRTCPYICALTAYSNEDSKNKCLSYQMDDFLTKPVSALDIKNLMNKLSSIIDLE